MCHAPVYQTPAFVGFFDYEQQKAFRDECVDLILNDNQLDRSWPTLISQWQFEECGTRMLIDSNMTFSMTISMNEAGVTSQPPKETTPSRGIPLNELTNGDILFDEPLDSPLDIAVWWQMQRLYKGEVPFYSAIISDLLRQDIRIDQMSMVSSEIMEKIFDAADNKPELQHILINSLTIFPQNKDYLLFLLTKRKWSTLAIYLLKITAPTLFHHSMVNNTPTSLHHIYWPMLCDEFLGVTFIRAENENFNDLVSPIGYFIKKFISYNFAFIYYNYTITHCLDFLHNMC